MELPAARERGEVERGIGRGGWVECLEIERDRERVSGVGEVGRVGGRGGGRKGGREGGRDGGREGRRCKIMFIHTQYTDVHTSKHTHTHTSHHSHTGIPVRVCNLAVVSHSTAGCYSDGTVPLTRAPSDAHHSSHSPRPALNGMGCH